MMKKTGLLLILMLLLIPTSLAISNYNESGNFDNLYSNGEGRFGNVPLGDSFTSTVLSIGGRKHPLVSDLDADGKNEIIVLDGTTIRLYHDKELTDVNNLVLPTNERVSNMLAFNIDGDSFTEIIFFAEESETMWIVEYNGTTLKNQTTFDLNETITDKETMIKCGAVNDCLMVYTTNIESGVAQVRMISFNSSGFSSSLVQIDSDTTEHGFCLPKIRSMTYKDFDNDGTSEYIFSYLDNLHQSGTDEAIVIHAVDTTSGTPVSEYIIIKVMGEVTTGGSNCESLGQGRFITPPLVADVDAGGADEIIVGHMVSDETFEISVFNGVGCSSNDACLNTNFPLFFTAQGEIISNVMLGNVFGDTGEVDFCVMGHDDENEELDLLCASIKTNLAGLSQSVEFKFSTDTQYNLSQSHDNMEAITHNGEYVEFFEDIGGTGQNNAPEFVTSYGVFRLEDDTFNGSLFVKTLTRVYINERGQSAVIPVDVENFGFNDLLVLTSNNLFYIDDGQSLGGADLSFPTFDPCPDGVTIKINETMDISVISSDNNPVGIPQDNVNVSMTVYAGDNNEQTQNFSGLSGTLFQSINFFQLNKTITNGAITIKAHDESNPTEIASFERTFTVGLFGIEKGDATCEFLTGAEEDADAEDEIITEATLTADATSNSIINFLSSISLLTGLAGITLWLVIMIVLTLGIWHEMSERGLSGASATGTIAIFNFLMIILGTRLGILSSSLIVIMVLGMVVIMGVFLGKFFLSSRSSAE